MGHCVTWGPIRPPPQKKRGTAPSQCPAHVRCGQTAGWIKMPLGRDVVLALLGSGGTELDGTQLPLKGARPQF